MKPDIVVKRKRDGAVFVLDTKWKLLSDDPKNHCKMTQADMYQMYAYQKRYGAARALLIYPAHGELGTLAEDPPVFRTEGDAEVQVQFWRLDGADGAAESAGRVFGAAEVATPGDL